MKILMITKFYKPHIGGIEKHIENLVKNPKFKDIKVKLITEKYDNKLSTHESLENIEVYRFSYPKIKYVGLFVLWIKLLFYYSKLVKESDIVHIHDVFIWYLPLKLLFWKKPVYITFHGYESYPIRNIAKFIHYLAEKNTNGNICVGDFIPKWYGTKPTKIIFGGVVINTRAIKKPQYDVVCMGRMDDQTGVMQYFNALKKIKRNNPNLNCLFVGDGIYRNEIERVFPVSGFINNPEKIMIDSKIILVSRYLSFLEAFMCKRSVVACYDNPVKKDYLYMSPYAEYVDIAGSTKELVSYINLNLVHPNKVRINKAYNFARSMTWGKVAKAYLDLWQIK